MPTTLGRRRRILSGLVAIAVAIAVGGLAATTRIKSPADIAAEAAAPPATTLTAAVQRTKVVSTVVIRGTVTSERTIDVAAVTSPGTQSAILTAVRKEPGASVAPGDVLLEVSGRPLVVLRGDIPAYRDLKPGLRGDDVAQLQRALAALGHASDGDEPGTYGPGTKHAVQALYESLGYEAPDSAGPDGSDEAVAAVRDAVVQAQRRVEELEGAPEPRDAAAARQLRYAREDLALARGRQADVVARSGPMVPLAEVLFIPDDNARVQSVGGRVGDQVRSPLARLSAGAVVVEGKLDPGDARLVRERMSARVDAEAAGHQASGRVSAVLAPVVASSDPAATGPGAAGVGVTGTYVPVIVHPDKPLPPSLIGQDVRITIEAASSEGDVLAVPQAAVTAGADGELYVTRLVDGARQRVRVRAGLSGGGLVEVSAAPGGELAVGDEVVTGE